MKTIFFVFLYGLSITVIHGFKFGVDQPIRRCDLKLCRRDLSYEEKFVEFVGDYTNWPIPCPFNNRITIECSGFINPNARIELYDYDDYTSDDLLATFKWNHIHEGKKKAYFDAFVSVRKLDSSDSEREPHAELYFKLRNPCFGEQNKEYRIQNVITNYTFIPD